LRSTADWKGVSTCLPALTARAKLDDQQALDTGPPCAFHHPVGRKKSPIDYSLAAHPPDRPAPCKRSFGTTRPPMIAGSPYRSTLLSPAQASVQVLRADLPCGSGGPMPMCARIIARPLSASPWPEDPTQGRPTLAGQARGTLSCSGFVAALASKDQQPAAIAQF